MNGVSVVSPEVKKRPNEIITLYAGTAKGEVVKVMMANPSLTWREIQSATGLAQSTLNQALKELFDSEEIYKDNGRYNVSQRLFFPNRRLELISWINKWKEVKKLDFSLEHEHFFLEGRYLDDFSKDLISQAKFEVLVVNPFIQDCDLSNTLLDVRKQWKKVQLITRAPRDVYPDKLEKKKDYHLKLRNAGISMVYRDKVHAKLIVVDGVIAVVSSMNFYPESSAGVSWEIGLISTNQKVVDTIVSSLFSRLGLVGSPFSRLD